MEEESTGGPPLPLRVGHPRLEWPHDPEEAAAGVRRDPGVRPPGLPPFDRPGPRGEVHAPAGGAAPAAAAAVGSGPLGAEAPGEPADGRPASPERGHVDPPGRGRDPPSEAPPRPDSRPETSPPPGRPPGPRGLARLGELPPGCLPRP